MKPEKVFKRYDVRGEYPGELDEEFAERMGKALGTFSRKNYAERVVVCRDNKKSSEPLKEALIDGIQSTGVEVLDTGVGTTDYAAFVGNHHYAVSVQVTSSHMPLSFNGLKFMYPEGNGFLNEDLNRLKELFLEEDFEAGEGGIKDAELHDRYGERFIEFVEEHGGGRRGKIVIDTLGGAASTLPGLLEELGFEVINLTPAEHPQYDPPNPKPEMLDELAARVEEEDADLGLAVDMDADRVAAYNGDWINGDQLFAVFAQLFPGRVVASIDSSSVLEEFADEVVLTRVGDPFVIDRMIREDASLSGEPNGHYCFPGFVNYNSGGLAAALLASIELEEYLENIPGTHIAKANIDVEDRERVMENTARVIASKFEVLSDKDGVKFTDGEAVCLVRPSGSSPVVRIKAESPERGAAENLRNRAEEIVRNS